MKRIFIYIVFFFNAVLYGQNSISDYFAKNSIKLNDIQINKVDSLGLYNYQGYFFGENHFSDKVPDKECIMINILNKKVNHVFIETPVSIYYLMQDFIKKTPRDTAVGEFDELGGSKANGILLRNLYRNNLTRVDSLKYQIFPIDMVYKEAINNKDLLWFLKRRFKIIPKAVKTGVSLLKYIETDTSKFQNEDSLVKQYALFRENFYSHESLYRAYLKNTFQEVKKNIDGIYAYTLDRNELTNYKYVSNARENFMFNNISNQLQESHIKNFISINGSFHTTLTSQKKWIFGENWEPLTAKFKRLNPTVNVCSIYFMDRNKDELGDEYFPEEKNLIFENIKLGETYLIRLDGENTPFKDLSEKFKYIVAW